MARNSQALPFRLSFSHYAKLGYDPCPTDGKVPVGGKGWNTREYTDADLIGLDATDYNVGLRCSNIVGIDIDLTDKAHAQAVEKLVRKVLKLPKSTPRRIGRAPKALLVVRVDQPMKGFDLAHDAQGKRNVLFQVLGEGKQFVVDGIHPDTHKPYTLSAPLPKWSDLPLVTPESMEAMRTAVSLLLIELGYNVHATGATGKVGNGKWSDINPWSKVGMAQAQEKLDELDPDMTMNEWAMVGMALHDGTHGSEEGLAMWDAWSSGGEKYKSRRDLVNRWNGFKAGGAITKATIFKNDFPKLAGATERPQATRKAKAGTSAPPVEAPEDVEGEDEAGDLFIEGVYLPFSKKAPELPLPVVMHWLPRKSVTLFGSHGGTGKSYVGLEVAVRVVLGLDVFGCKTDPVNTIFYSCEDEQAVMRDRADRIAIELGHKPSDLDGRLFLLDMTSHTQPELYRETREGGAVTTTFPKLFNTVERVDAGLVVIDNASDVFAANENDRTKVREFMRMLKAPAQEMDLAILLLAHTNKVTAQAKAGEDVQGYSGSTAWHNSARSRWFMAFDKDDPELRVLSLDKSNYGKSGLTVEVRWHESKKLLLSGEAVARKPLNELAGAVLKKVAHYDKTNTEMLVSMKAPGTSSLQAKLRKDVPELRRRRATEVQEFLDMLARDGFLAIVERPRGGRNKSSVKVFTLGERAKEAGVSVQG